MVQGSSQTSRQTYWQAGGRLAGRDRHASQHVSGQRKSNPRASGHASQHASGRASQHASKHASGQRQKQTHAHARTHTDITIRSWQHKPAGKAQHRSDRTNTASSPTGTKKARHDAVHITNTESSGSRHKTFVANTQGATRSNTHSRICGHYRHETY